MNKVSRTSVLRISSACPSDAAAAHMASARTPNYSPPPGISCRPEGRAPLPRSVRQPRQAEYSGARAGNMEVWRAKLEGTLNMNVIRALAASLLGATLLAAMHLDAAA